MTSATDFPSVEALSRISSLFAVFSATVAATILLLPEPLADVFFAGWVLFSVVLSVVGGTAAWTNRTPLVWVAAILLSTVSVLGMMSIGLLLAPAALFLLCAAAFSQVAGPREDVRAQIVADPPTETETALKTLAGIGSVAVGAGLIYIGAITQELFGPCASETLACALEKTHLDGVAVTALGLAAISLGGWLVWKQVYIVRVLAASEVE